MELHFAPEQEAQLAQIATQEGIDAERLVKDAALRLLERDARSRAAVREGIAQADRGEFIEEEEMDARLEQMCCSTPYWKVAEQIWAAYTHHHLGFRKGNPW